MPNHLLHISFLLLLSLNLFGQSEKADVIFRGFEDQAGDGWKEQQRQILSEEGEQIVSYYRAEQHGFSSHVTMGVVEVMDLRLNTVWSDTFHIPEYAWLGGHQIKGNRLYMILHTQNGFVLMLYDVRDGSLLVKQINNEFRLEMTHYACGDKQFYIGGHINFSPAIMQIDIGNDEGKPKLLTMVSHLEANIVDIYYHEHTQIFTAVLSEGYQTIGRNTYVNRYAPDGKLVGKHKVTKTDQINYLSFQLVEASSEKAILTGLYALKSRETSQGVFFLTLEDGMPHRFRFHDFASFSNYFDGLPEKKKEKEYEKYRGKKEKGKPYFFQHNLLEYRPRLVDGQLLCMFDNFDIVKTYSPPVYYADGFGNNNMGRRSLNRVVPASRQESIDGYDVSNTILCLFNEKGELVWDDNIYLGKYWRENLVSSNVVAVNDCVNGVVVQNEGELVFHSLNEGGDSKNKVPSSVDISKLLESFNPAYKGLNIENLGRHGDDKLIVTGAYDGNKKKGMDRFIAIIPFECLADEI